MKILHISFHKGCQNDIQYICDKLGIELDFMEFDDGITKTAAKYNIGHERANNCWNKYKDYFNTFDAILTSDTAPISRVFLQNNFQKKLIIWVCNRFDYADYASLDCNFPDKDYYDMIRISKYMKNVIIAGYTPFENYYAKNIKNVDIGNLVIKPLGLISNVYNNFVSTNIENKKKTFLIPPYHNENNFMNLKEKLESLNIKTYNGRYNGPRDLAEFAGVIHIPYAWSNLALFEGLQNSIIYFIPSKSFFLQLSKMKNFWFQNSYCIDQIDLCEWYCQEFKDAFIYFDSWDDLKTKINKLDYVEHKKILQKIAENNYNKTIEIWRNIFNYTFSH